MNTGRDVSNELDDSAPTNLFPLKPQDWLRQKRIYYQIDGPLWVKVWQLPGYVRPFSHSGPYPKAKQDRASALAEWEGDEFVGFDEGLIVGG